MPRFTQFGLAVALALSLQSAAFAQLQPIVPPTLSVQRLAPQLVAFAGSPINFQNLVNGLSFGTPVQLTTVLPDGSTQVVSFTPTGQMSPSDIARTLEAARQQLISLGIATPTAQQIGTVLAGGFVPTALGGTQVPGQLNAAAGGTAAPSVTTTTPATNVRSNTSDSLVAPGTTSRSPTQDAAAPAAGVTSPQVTAAPIAGAPETTPATAPSATQTTPPATPATQSAPLRR